jgi:hypothetical protein
MAPRLLTACYFDIDGVRYPAQVTEAKYNPAAPVIARDIDGTTVASEVPIEGSTLTMKGLQDFETAGSLALLLEENQGEQATIIYSPRELGDFYRSIEVILPAPQMGGPRNMFGPLDLTFQCLTKPTTVAKPEGAADPPA